MIRDFPWNNSFGKKAILNRWECFLMKYFAKDLSTANIFCLPSVTGLELDIYSNMNADSKNIWGTERDCEYFYEMSFMNKYKNINLFLGELDEFIVHFMNNWKNIHFDIMNLDLCGKANTFLDSLTDYFEPFLLGNGLCLAITTLSERDSKYILFGSWAANYIRSAIDGNPIILELINRCEWENQYINKCSNSQSSPDNMILRDLGFLWWLVVSIGSHTYNSNPKYVLPDKEFINELKNKRNKLKNKLPKKESKKIKFIQDFSFAELFNNKIVWFWPIHMERFLYISKSNHTMKSFFIKLKKANNLFQTKTLQQVMEDTIDLFVNSSLHHYDKKGQLSKILRKEVK